MLIFGLYHVPHQEVETQIHQAQSLGFTHFDTAQLYGNEAPCAKLCLETDFITTKIYTNKIDNMVKRSARRFGTRKINSMLLHRPMPNESWATLMKYGDRFDLVGISNYDLQSLKDLLIYCDTHKLRTPEVHQMEVHPFVDCIPLINFCKQAGIKITGHTILTQGKFLNHPDVVTMATKYHCTPAQILMAWARSKDIDLCVNSKSLDHLKELTQVVRVSTDDLSEIDAWHQKLSYRFYKKLNIVPHTLNGIENTEEYVSHITNQLKADMEADYPSNICEHLPTAGESYRTVGRVIANLLFGEDKKSINKYRILIKNLKTKRIAHHKAGRMNKKGLSCCVVRRTTGEYSESITNPKPMPVNVTAPEEFDPFFSYLRSAEAPPQGDTVFVRGAMFPDGRMDLCKQVVGPSSIVRLCETVASSKIVKHFLLGNNVAFQENEEVGAQAVADLMKTNTSVVTYYFAGNNITHKGINIMAESLKMNTVCKALWLKRNPIGPLGAVSLNSMLQVNNTLVLLDLHNCALGDEGVQNLLSGDLPALKHLYLDANGIESTTAVSKWCQRGHPVTLFLSINRLGDDAIIELADACHGNPTLKRLCLASTHLGNRGVQALVTMALSCSKLKSLDLGCYKSTCDLGEHPGNFYDDAVVPDLKRLITESTALKYLSTTKCKISVEGLLSLPRLDTISFDLGVGPWHHVHDKETLRAIKQPKRVVHIDSIYRGKM